MSLRPRPGRPTVVAATVAVLTLVATLCASLPVAGQGAAVGQAATSRPCSDDRSSVQPPWFEAGLEAASDGLWAEPPSAIAETAQPIDHGDVWAWTGDNAKFLGAAARSAHPADERNQDIRDFLLEMHEGPLLFKRWANTHEPVIVQDTPDVAEVSNHLLTLRLDRATLQVEAELEYHDGRDKSMVRWGPAQAEGPQGSSPLSAGDATVWREDGRTGFTVQHTGPGVHATESFWLDASAIVHHTLEVQEGTVEGWRFPMEDLRVRRADQPEQARGYTSVHVGGKGTVRASGLSDLAPPPWMMLLDPGTSDEFASGLLLRPGTAWTGVDFVQQGGRVVAGSTQHEGDQVSEDAVLLDGVLTKRLETYGDLVALVRARPGIDPGLSYEASETTLGLLEYAAATGDDEARRLGTDLFRSYLGHYERGTQTRSLASAVLTALCLHALDPEGGWLATARTLAHALHGYQVEEGRPEAGAVLNEPDGGPFLDSTVVAARAWGDLADATGDQRFRTWSQAAWGSLEAEGDHVFIRGDRADDNEWTFKSGLLLQGGADVPDDVRWAALNHAWVTLRDLPAFEFRTSRYSAQTNSETQAWMMLGLLADRRSTARPWVLDAEGPLAQPVQGPDGAWTYGAPWNGSYVWVEAGWVGVVDGHLAERVPGPHGSWRYTTGKTLTLQPAQQRALDSGWSMLGMAGLQAPTDPALALRGLDVHIAWAYDTPNGTWRHWRPDAPESTLTAVVPGQGLLVLLGEPGVLESPRTTSARPAQMADGWNLVADGSEARWVARGGGAGGTPPQPPMLVAGRVEHPFPYRLQGGVVQAWQEGASLGEAFLRADGGYVLMLHGKPGVPLTIEHREPDGTWLGSADVFYRPGELLHPAVAVSSPTSQAALGWLAALLLLLVSLLALVMLVLAVWRAHLVDREG